MGDWKIIASGEAAALAPNILNSGGTLTTVTPVYSCPFNDSVYQLSVSISVDVGNVHIGRLKKIHVLNSLTGLQLVPALFRPAAGWTSPVTFVSDTFSQDRASHSGTLTFDCENDAGDTTPGAVSVGFTVQASAVTGFTSAAEVGTRYIEPRDVATKLVSLTVGFIPILNGGQVPQNVFYLVSPDNGATFTPIGWQMMKAVGQQLTFGRLAPGVDQTWKVAAATGAQPSVSVPVTAGNLTTLYPGAVVSTGFAVAALAVPLATLISTITVAAGGGGATPYNAKRPDGSQYWKIPAISYTNTGAVGAPDAFYIRVTAEDLNAAHSPVGPEHAYTGSQVGQTAETFTTSLMGEYGTDGFSYLRTGNIAYVRLRLYVCNRVDQTEQSFANALCATVQTDVGSGAGYVDVLVASGGDLPPGAMDPSRLDDSLWPHPGNITPGTPTSRVISATKTEITWPFTAPGDDYFLGVVLEVEAPDQSAYPQAKADGTTAWDGTRALTGDKKPLLFVLAYNAANPQPLAAIIDTPAVAMSVRLRARSQSLNLTNVTGPEAVLTVPGATVPKPGSGSAVAPCVGGISAAVGTAYNRDGKLKTPIAVTVTGLPSTNPAWAGYVIFMQWPGGAPVPCTGVLANAGQIIDLDTPSTVLSVILWAVSRSIDSTGTIVTNPIVPGVTPFCTVSIGTTGYTIPPTAAPPTSGMAIAVTITSGPSTPAGIETYGWHGTVTRPSDLTFYGGCQVTKQYTGEVEGGSFAGLSPDQTTFDNGYYPRPTYTTQITFRAYPVNKDGVRGTAVSCVVTLGPHSSGTLNAKEINPLTMGPGYLLDPVTGKARVATGNFGTSLLLDWDFSLSKLGTVVPGMSQWTPGGFPEVRNDGDAFGNYVRLPAIGTNLQQTFVMSPSNLLFLVIWTRSAVVGSAMAVNIYWLDALDTPLGYTAVSSGTWGAPSGWTQGGAGSAFAAPANTAKGIFQLIVTATGSVDFGKIALSPRW